MGSWESCLRISSLLRPKLTAADLRELQHGCGAGETVTADMVWAAPWPSEDAEHAGDAPTARLLLSLYVCCVCSGAESWGDLGSSGWAQPRCLSSLLRAGWPLSAPKPALKGCFVPASPCLLVCHHPLCHRGQQCPSIPSLLSCSTPNPSPGGVPALPLLPPPRAQCAVIPRGSCAASARAGLGGTWVPAQSHGTIPISRPPTG